MTMLEQTPLWQTFSAVADDRQRVMVDDLIAHARPLLARIPDSFPTYTLHDETHAINVVRRMGDLLGPHIGRITALEGAILLLSAYYHDIGMVYDDNELASLQWDVDFKKFLRDNAEAEILFHEANEQITPRIAEWYCRWRHADRVFVHLNAIQPPERLRWGVVSIREVLGAVCRSHNLPAKELKDDLFAVDYLHECDLRMCAILLRLADILDFDRSRTPESLFEHLDLAAGNTEQVRASRDEWAKHLCSDGFRFPDIGSSDYQVALVAAPDNPDVDHDMREFLDIIDAEFAECGTVRRSCAERWRDMPLPASVDRRQIHPDGYRYGNYRFELDRSRVLRLFMGDNLYESKHTFIRELLQNALDASRHRQYIEHAAGDTSFTAEPIEVRDWRDSEGHRWIRFDDYGTGMDEQIIEQYFLAVGQSYYRSARFRADLLRLSKRHDERFEPISRFGIGVLSCFILGDRVEVSTRHCSDADPVRLSLKGLDSYYTVQSSPIPGTPMPCPGGDEPGYRSKPGTSIAVRISATKEEPLDLPEVVNRYVLCPPVPVHVNGTQVGGTEADLLSTPWLTEPIYLPFLPDGSIDESAAGPDDPGGPVVKIVPYDLSAHSPDPRVEGQLIIVFVRTVGSAIIMDKLHKGHVRCTVNVFDATHIEEFDVPISIDLSHWTRLDRKSLRSLLGSANFSHNGIRIPRDTLAAYPYLAPARTVPIQLSSSLNSGEKPSPYLNNMEYQDKEVWNWSTPTDSPSTRQQQWMDHIERIKEIVKSNPEKFPKARSLKLRGCKWSEAQLIGFVRLRDELQPTYSAARDIVMSWPWKVMSAIHLAFFRALNTSIDPSTRRVIANHFAIFGSAGGGNIVDISTRHLLEDPLIQNTNGWSSEPVLPLFSSLPEYTPKSFLARPIIVTTHNDLLHQQKTLPELGDNLFVTTISINHPIDVAIFTDLMNSTLLYSQLRLAYDPQLNLRNVFSGIPHRVLGPRPSGLPGSLRQYPPCAFVEYLNSDLLRHRSAGLNIDHPFATWLLDATPALLADKPGLHTSLWNELSRYYGDDEDLQQAVATINHLLDVLRVQRFASAPPTDLVLRTDDFDIS